MRALQPSASACGTGASTVEPVCFGGALRRGRRGAQTLIAEARDSRRPLDLAALEAYLLADDERDTTLVIGHWTYAGTDWRTDTERVLATAAAAGPPIRPGLEDQPARPVRPGSAAGLARRVDGLTWPASRSGERGAEVTWLARWRDETGRQRKRSFSRRIDAQHPDGWRRSLPLRCRPGCLTVLRSWPQRRCATW